MQASFVVSLRLRLWIFLLDKLKKIDLLDVIVCVAQSDEFEPLTIVHSWRKLLDHLGNEFFEIEAKGGGKHY